MEGFAARLPSPEDEAVQRFRDCKLRRPKLVRAGTSWTVQEAGGVSFRWRPFSVRAIMIEQKNVPFAGKPVKMAYMWRDIERRARTYGFEPKIPAPYPLAEFDLANRIAIVAASDGWCSDYARAAY